jgi:SAM-dependent methyltransferase
MDTFDFWEKKAESSQETSSVTHGDVHQRELEISVLLELINKKDTVLDVGCGNGYSSQIFAEHCKEVSGLDFSPAMIERAKKENPGKGNISYFVGDARDFMFKQTFSVVITERCLINIMDWEEQKKAIANIANHVKSGGYFLMMEGLHDGRKNLDLTRTKLGLSPLSIVNHNLDFHKMRTEEWLKKFFRIEEVRTFGTYEFITRVIYPLVILPKEPSYGSPFHKTALNVCRNMQDAHSEISKLILWILRKP